jgi:hypothetical protein
MGILLCIDGLPLHYRSKDLRSMAEAAGAVLQCWIVTQPGTQISVRFGYVEAATSADAERMVAALRGQRLNCKPCTVAIQQAG